MTYVLAQTGMGSMLDNRPATATGLLGAMGCGLLAVLLAHPSPRAADHEPLDELPFVPGMVLALGSLDTESVTAQPATTPATPEDPTEPTPEDPASEPTEPEPTPENAVTEDDVTPPAPPRPPRPPRPPSSDPTLTGRLPTPPAPGGGPSKGNPFGDPSGFDDLTTDGDAWARGVIAALDAMDVGTIYARPIEGTVRFEITICKDGTISRVSAKGGTATIDERDQVLLEVERVKIPRPPADIAAQMKGQCTKLRHTFAWTTKGTR